MLLNDYNETTRLKKPIIFSTITKSFMIVSIVLSRLSQRFSPPLFVSSIKHLSSTITPTMASTSMSCSSKQQSPFKSKRILFVRHGQATHNPRAEEAKENGCSHETFMRLMQEDDQFDSELTPLGIEQAIRGRDKSQHLLVDVDLVVSSPLSRALKTADLFICPERGIDTGVKDTRHPKRICIEDLREINGLLLNAKRRTKAELENLFHQRWNFELLPEEDKHWTEDMEAYDDCSERGYYSLLWLLRRSEDKVLVVSHGGILRFSMVDHPLVELVDDRDQDNKRFSNCELREYFISIKEDNHTERPVVILTEIRNGS